MPIPTRGTDRRDVVDVLIEDHIEVAELLVMLEARLGDADQRRSLADVMIAELVRHAVSEEAYVYPMIRDRLPDGGHLVRQELEEHRETEALLRRLEGLDSTDPEFDALVRDIASTTRRHIVEEEMTVLPALREACDPAELTRLGERVERAKRIAPTRPHPSEPDRPSLDKLVTPGVGLVDRLRGTLTGRPTRAEEAS